MKTFRLNNGCEIPQIGFGVFMITDPSECEEAVDAGKVRSIGISNFDEARISLDFTLSDDDMNKIRAIDRDTSYFNTPEEEQERMFLGQQIDFDAQV